MKKEKVSITSPEDFNKRLQRTSPVTWIILGVVVSLLVALFIWAFTFKLADKVEGVAIIKDGVITLQVNEEDRNKLIVGQKVTIDNYNTKIISLDDNEVLVNDIELKDGEYQYVTSILRPIDFVVGK